MITNNIPELNHVRDNLQIWLDPRPKTSYNGSSTYKDLSGNGYDFTMTNNGFSTANGGILTSNGSTTRGGRTHNSAHKYNLSITKKMTASVWVKFDVLTNTHEGVISHGLMFGSSTASHFKWYLVKGYNVTYGHYLSFFITKQTADRGWAIGFENRSGYQLNTLLVQGKFHCIDCTYDNDTQSIAMYIDGVKQTTIHYQTTNFTTLPDPSSNFNWLTLMGNYDNTTRSLDGKTGSYKYYDRALSEAEVQHNYKLQKLRYS